MQAEDGHEKTLQCLCLLNPRSGHWWEDFACANAWLAQAEKFPLAVTMLYSDTIGWDSCEGMKGKGRGFQQQRK